MKKEGHRFFSNRLLYSLIALGIVTILAVGVYAYGTTTPATFGHSAGEIEETDPQVGTLTASKWCASNVGGTAVVCDKDTPASPWIVSGKDIYYYESGNVAIGKTSANVGVKLDVVGFAVFTRTVTAESFIYTSDKSLKTNIQPLQNPLSTVQQLQGVSFNWKANGEKSIGLIAQDVEKVLPELVSGTEGNKGVAYGNVVALLIEAVKEQQKQIDELKSQIQELKEN